MCELIDSYAQALADGVADPVPANVVKTAELRIRAGLEQLPEREAAAVALRFGLDATPLSVGGVAQRLNLSPQRTEQLIDRGLSQLGSYLYALEAT